MKRRIVLRLQKMVRRASLLRMSDSDFPCAHHRIMSARSFSNFDFRFRFFVFSITLCLRDLFEICWKTFSMNIGRPPRRKGAFSLTTRVLIQLFVAYKKSMKNSHCRSSSIAICSLNNAAFLSTSKTIPRFEKYRGCTPQKKAALL